MWISILQVLSLNCECQYNSGKQWTSTNNGSSTVATHKTMLRPVICACNCMLSGPVPITPYEPAWNMMLIFCLLPKHWDIFAERNNCYCCNLYTIIYSVNCGHYVIVTMFFILTTLISSILIHKERFSVLSSCASSLQHFNMVAKINWETQNEITNILIVSYTRY